jgi:predicted CXXCH cytochrome family protein
MARITKYLAGLAVATLGFVTATAPAQITNSSHDFSSMAWSGGEICKPCHTPHNAIDGQPRLWNHELTTATYEMHSGTGTAVVDFDQVSRMCLSCHDGTVALDSFGGTTGTSFIPGGANLGTDLTDDHPVGSDAEYPPDPAPSWWTGAFNSTLPSAIRLKNWTNPGGTVRPVVGCTTCHNAHNRGNFGNGSMLVMSNSASALCLGCHIK